MGKQPEFMWNEETGMCTCAIVLDDFLQGFGIAECHPNDEDVKSEYTGSHIAELRAQINLLQNFKNRELRPGLKALLHLKGTMILSKKYNPDSYEAKRLNVEIKNFRKDIEDIQKAIEETKQNLYDYINLKELVSQRNRMGIKKGYTPEDSANLIEDIKTYERLIGDKYDEELDN